MSEPISVQLRRAAKDWSSHGAIQSRFMEMSAHAERLEAKAARMEQALRDIVYCCEHDACGMNGYDCHACRIALPALVPHA